MNPAGTDKSFRANNRDETFRYGVRHVVKHFIADRYTDQIILIPLVRMRDHVQFQFSFFYVVRRKTKSNKYEK